MIRTPLCALAVVGCTFAVSAQKTQPAPLANNSQATVSQQNGPGTELEFLEGKVVSVENGDTITVQIPGNSTRLVKLQAIDAPDIGQPYFENSKQGLAKLIRGKDIRLVISTTSSNGVIIGTVYRQGHDVGLTLLEQGWAWHYKRFAYQQTPSARKSYADAQSAATAGSRGLWTETNPIPPWVFRGEPVSAPAKTSSAVTTPDAQPTPASERKYILGPRGGCYYVSESGSKVYVQDKKLCGVRPPDVKP